MASSRSSLTCALARNSAVPRTPKSLASRGTRASSKRGARTSASKALFFKANVAASGTGLLQRGVPLEPARAIAHMKLGRGHGRAGDERRLGRAIRRELEPRALDASPISASTVTRVSGAWGKSARMSTPSPCADRASLSSGANASVPLALSAATPTFAVPVARSSGKSPSASTRALTVSASGQSLSSVRTTTGSARGTLTVSARCLPSRRATLSNEIARVSVEAAPKMRGAALVEAPDRPQILLEQSAHHGGKALGVHGDADRRNQHLPLRARHFAVERRNSRQLRPHGTLADLGARKPQPHRLARRRAWLRHGPRRERRRNTEIAARRLGRERDRHALDTRVLHDDGRLAVVVQELARDCEHVGTDTHATRVEHHAPVWVARDKAFDGDARRREIRHPPDLEAAAKRASQHERERPRRDAFSGGKPRCSTVAVANAPKNTSASPKPRSARHHALVFTAARLRGPDQGAVGLTRS